MTVPQLQAMPAGDRSRKANLVKYWFRLPSALDHRPLNFSELEKSLGRSGYKIKDDLANEEINSKSYKQLQKTLWIVNKSKVSKKKEAKTIFLSATPAEYEMQTSEKIIEQIIRPTGLLDPITYIYPKSGDYKILKSSLDDLIQKKPHIKDYLDWYTFETKKSDLFENE